MQMAEAQYNYLFFWSDITAYSVRLNLMFITGVAKTTARGAKSARRHILKCAVNFFETNIIKTVLKIMQHLIKKCIIADDMIRCNLSAKFFGHIFEPPKILEAVFLPTTQKVWPPLFYKNLYFLEKMKI